MQQPDDRRRGPSRPSLFSEDPPPAADSLGILSQLDGKAAAPSRVSPRPRNTAKMAAALALVGVVGAGGWWAAGAGDAADGSQPGVAASRPAPVASAHAPAPALAVAPAAPIAVPAVDEREVSAATILDGTTAAAVPTVLTAAGDRTTTLAQALEAPAKPGAKGAEKGAEKDEVTAMFDAPAAATTTAAPAKPGSASGAQGEKREKRAKAEPAKLAAKEKRRDTARDPERKTRHVAHRSSTARSKAAPAKDSDAALLEALLSHTRTVDGGTKTQQAAKGK